MAAMTLAEARTQVADHLDDPNNRRWTTTQLDAALRQSLSSCVSAYVTAGGTGLDEETTFTCSSTGAADLTTVAPVLKIQSVQVQQGTSPNVTFWRIQPLKKIDRAMLVQNAYVLKTAFVRDFVLPATTSHPLIGNGATAAASWPALEGWICADAALRCGIKDNDQRPGLQMLEQRARADVLDRLNQPKAYPLAIGAPVGLLGPYGDRIAFVYTASLTAPTMQLVRPYTGAGVGGW